MVASSNVPSPEVVHNTDCWFVAVPDKVRVASSHMVTSDPAPEVGRPWMVKTILSVASAAHGVMANAVKDSVAVPADISFVPGV